MSTTEAWFERGQEAFGRGEPRALEDQRVSVSHRRAFFEGFDEAARLNYLRKLTPEELRASLERWRQLRQALESPPEQPVSGESRGC